MHSIPHPVTWPADSLPAGHIDTVRRQIALSCAFHATVGDLFFYGASGREDDRALALRLIEHVLTC